MERSGAGIRSVLPVLIFIPIFMGAGIFCFVQGYEKPFSQLPASMAAYISLLLSFLILKGSFNDKFNWMLAGIAQRSTAIRLSVLALACGFSKVAKECGAVEAVVGICLNHVPAVAITACFFIVGCILSSASGSSLDTVVAMGPIVIAAAASIGIPVSMAVAIVLGSSMFGNSFTPISDCTIVSNSIIGIGVGKAAKDKLLAQIKLYIVPFIITVVLLLIFGRPEVMPELETYETNIPAMLPYVFIIICAVKGINFVLALSSGIVLAVAVGVFQGAFGLLQGLQSVSSGMYDAVNMMLLFLFMSGIIGMVSEAGGIEWLTGRLTRLVRGRRSAEAVMFIMSILATCCMANDTIPMVAIGDALREITEKYRVDPRRTAYLLPIATAGTVMLLPYTGVSLTIMTYVESYGLDASVFQSIPYNWFVLSVFAFVFLTIFIPFNERHFAGNPWDYAKWEAENESFDNLREKEYDKEGE